jgi:hypothetical protein
MATDNPQEELERLRQENEVLKKRLEKHEPPPASQEPEQLSILPPDVEATVATGMKPITNHSPVQEKIALFRSLFRGRDDVYAERWESEYSGKKGYSPVCENKWSVNPKEKKKYIPLTDQVIEDHLSGKKTIGIYPIRANNRTWFLA